MTEPTFSFIKRTCLLLTLFALIVLACLFQKNANDIIHWINGLGWLAPLCFILIYALASIIFLPTMVLTIAGGAIFGPLLGTVLNLFGATLGAALSFLIMRHLIYNKLFIKPGERLNRLIHGVEQRGWMFVALLRVVPIIPFNIVNYGLGITGIKFRLYLLTTFIFLIPAEIVYTYCGYAGMNALADPEHFYRNGGIALTGLAIVFLFVLRLLKNK